MNRAAAPPTVSRRSASRVAVRTCVVLAGIACACAVLGGCSAQAGRADGERAVSAVGDHLDEAASAVATAQLALQSVRDGLLPAVTADATIGRAVESVTTAAHDLAALVPPAAARDAVQARLTAWHAVADGVAAVAEARVALGADDDAALRQAIAVLDDAETALDDAASRLQEPR